MVSRSSSSRNALIERFRRAAFGCALLASLLLLASGCASAPRGTASASVSSLDVAIYPYVPRPDQFEAAISAAWKEKRPEVALNFVDWDCYSQNPLPDLDVFAFDAIFLDAFHAGGFLAPIAPGEVAAAADILPYALRGSRIDGTLYGIPQLGCGSVLFYREGDAELAAAETLDEVVGTLGECTYSGLTPPPGVGLMVDLSGGTTNACLYLEAVEDIYGKYTPDPPLPPEEARIDRWAIQNVQKLLRMASPEQASYSGDNPYQRAAWFGEGLGRAVIGYTESMSAMGEKGRETVAFKLMPLADEEGVSLFYSDIIGINSKAAERGTRALALELANLMASAQVMLASLGPTPEADFPQYLMPVRHSVFEELGRRFPLYGEMYEMVVGDDPRLFRIGPESRPWLEKTKDQIRAAVFQAPSCE